MPYMAMAGGCRRYNYPADRRWQAGRYDPRLPHACHTPGSQRSYSAGTHGNGGQGSNPAKPLRARSMRVKQSPSIRRSLHFVRDDPSDRIAEPVPREARNLRLCFGFASQLLTPRNGSTRLGVFVQRLTTFGIILLRLNTRLSRFSPLSRLCPLCPLSRAG